MVQVTQILAKRSYWLLMVSSVAICLCVGKRFRDRGLKDPPREIVGKVVWDNIEHYMGDFHVGMPLNQLLEIFPPPSNDDTEKMCAWVFSDTERHFAAAPPERIGWRSVVAWPGAAVFVVLLMAR